MPMMVEQLVKQMHASPIRLVLALSGGGSRAIAELLEVPGASRTVLEVVVPYSGPALIDWLGGPPDQFCSAETARAMAMAAFRRACRLNEGEEPSAGVACTASLATDRPKRGPHRAHVAIQTAARTATRSLKLEKGRRSRAEEERLVACLTLNALAEACGLDRQLQPDLLPGEQIEQSETVAPQAWRDLLLGKVEAVRHGGPPEQGDECARAIFPGAFNPLHVGHRRMAEIAQGLLGVSVEYEISIFNPDKPPLDYFEIERRTGQFGGEQAVWLTRLPTFEEKSRRFPGATFIVGADTMRRIADPVYYGDSPTGCQAALEAIAARGCRFLVFGRAAAEGFLRQADLDLPDVLKRISREVPPEQFREEVSSTEIRRSGGW